MYFARLFGIFLLIYMCSCSENRQIQPSDYGVGNDDHNAPALKSFGKYFIYVNCTTCKVKSELQVEAKSANEEEEHLSKENTQTNRKHTHFQVSPGGGKRRIEGKTTSYGVTKEGGEGGQGRRNFTVISRGGGTEEIRTTTPYGEERKEEEKEDVEVEEAREAREEAERLERMKINETTASPIYHLPGDTPYPPWFTFKAGKIVKKTGTGSTEVTDIPITNAGIRGTEVTGAGRTGTEIRSTGEISTEVIGTGQAGTEATDKEETGTEEIGIGKTGTEETSAEVIDAGKTGSEETDTEKSVKGETGTENESTAGTTIKKKNKKP